MIFDLCHEFALHLFKPWQNSLPPLEDGSFFFFGFSAFFAGILGGLDSSTGVLIGGPVAGVIGATIANYAPQLQEAGVLPLLDIALANRPHRALGQVPEERV